MNDEDDFEEDSEPVGSCENCGCDVWECDAYDACEDLLCSQCYWQLTQVMTNNRKDSEQ